MSLSKRLLTWKSLFKRILGSGPTSRPLFENGPIQFAIGAQTWDSTSSQCSVGNWDNENFFDFINAFVGADRFMPTR
jgi:hypothetical protein